MSTYDLSRSATDFRKRYTSVRMQQGRVLMDDDWNENERLQEESQRALNVKVVGPAGSPDNGFRITNPVVDTVGDPDFTIQAGVYYVGGNRVELPESKTYQLQDDWLQKPGEEEPCTPVDGQFDLAYLELWQQPVTAVEDSELLEQALGGPDTTVRMRTMHRVHVVSNIGTEQCGQAWENLRYSWTTLGRGKIDADCRLVPDTRLTVDFVDQGHSGDICNPPMAGGYLGAENQAIRIQLVDSNSLTWGFDNAAPLYKVKLVANQDRNVFEMITPPKDQAHWPLSGQIVEILPWSAILPNHEVISEVMGHLLRVDSSYKPDKKQFSVLTKLSDSPGNFGESWTKRSDVTVLKNYNNFKDGNQFFYMRVWNRGVDITSEPAISLQNQPVLLGNTGLKITISGNDHIPGDYWIIAARPDTPRQVLPWRLAEGMASQGILRFYTPLAVIRWSVAGGKVTGEVVNDCRKTFRPLTQQQICCSFVVGDGKTTHGDFDSIQEALENLPASGGTLCLLPGVHPGGVNIQGRRNVRISGCGRRTHVIPAVEFSNAPIFTIRESVDIILESMEMVTFTGTAVWAGDIDNRGSVGLTVRDSRIMAGEHAIVADSSTAVVIAGNAIGLVDREGAGVAIYARGEELLIERNHLVVIPGIRIPPAESGNEDPTVHPGNRCDSFTKVYNNSGRFLHYADKLWTIESAGIDENLFYQAVGGIQIGAGSEQVTVRENHVLGGAGNGLSIGGLLIAPTLVDEGETATFKVSSANGRIAGFVATPAEMSEVGVQLSFTPAGTGQALQVVTGQEGSFAINAPTGTYQVAVLTPGLAIDNVSVTRPIANLYLLALKAADDLPSFQELLAFIYDVSVVENKIEGMGQNGIGNVVLRDLFKGMEREKKAHLAEQKNPVLQLFALLGNPIVGLSIRGNLITHCLQTPFNATMTSISTMRGLGGISLGMVDRGEVVGNVIERNGLSLFDPVCGIHVLYGEEVEIVRNRIVNNGSAQLAGNAEKLRSGIRGGIVVSFASAINIVDQLDSSGEPLMHMRPAARVHENIVEQPAGQALCIGAVGPVSVTDNSFCSNLSGSRPFDLLVGTVMIFNLGGMQKVGGGINMKQTMLKEKKDLAVSVADASATEVAGAKNYRQIKAAAVEFTRSEQAQTMIPSGFTLFANNQVRSGPTNTSIVCQLVVSLDDVTYTANQSRSDRRGRLFSNAMIFAGSLRASGNRLNELGMTTTLLSLYTLAIWMNSTTFNQGDHCIVATDMNAAMPEITTGNQVLFPAKWCRGVNQMSDYYFKLYR